MKFRKRTIAAAAVALAGTAPLSRAADHAESLLVIANVGADIADVYTFLDPNDNSKAVLAFDVRGFIVPGENGNIGPFQSDVLYQFSIENTGDAKPDRFVQITFDPQTSRSTPQMAHITIFGRQPGRVVRFDAPTTVGSPTAATAPAATVTTDPASGVSFFAGLREDPFFFDIPGFNRFSASVAAKAPDPALLTRGRDTFAGYNVQMIALDVPVALLKGSAGSVIGVSGTTYKSSAKVLRRPGTLDARVRALAFAPPFVEQIDRMGVPVINTVAIPFPRKDEYNQADTTDDAKGVFANDIVATLKGLGTSDANIATLASLAVTRGDQLRLDTSIPNAGPQGGTSAGAGFPNGRRPADDVIDTVIAVVTNGAITTGDNVNGNDTVFLDRFPFYAPPNQPYAPGTTDDRTRN